MKVRYEREHPRSRQGAYPALMAVACITFLGSCFVVVLAVSARDFCDSSCNQAVDHVWLALGVLGITTSAPELAQAVTSTWPSAAKARRASLDGSGTRAYEQAAVNAQVTATGEPSWGYVRNVNGRGRAPG